MEEGGLQRDALDKQWQAKHAELKRQYMNMNMSSASGAGGSESGSPARLLQ